MRGQSLSNERVIAATRQRLLGAQDSAAAAKCRLRLLEAQVQLAELLGGDRRRRAGHGV